MEEQEAPLEDVHEQIHHTAEHSRQGWVMGVAVSTALLAAVAAIASLLSGDNVNEAMIEHIRAADQWNYYQAKGIKSGQLATRIAILESLDKPVKDQDRAKLDEYARQQDEIKKEADEATASAEHRMKRHHVLAKSVTWSQIAIAISAISVLTKQKWFWALGLAFGAAGLVFLVWGTLV